MRLPHLICIAALLASRASATSEAETPTSESLALSLGVESEAESENPVLQDRLEAEEQKLDVLNGKLAKLKRELGDLGSEQTTILGELNRLDLQIRIGTEQLELLKLELQRNYRRIDENLERIRALEERIEALEPYLARRSASLYRLGRMSYVRLLLSVKEPTELTRAYRYVSRLAREDAKQMTEFLDSQRALEATKAELLIQTERMLATRGQLETTTRLHARQRASRTALLREITERREMTSTLVHELEDARERLGELIVSLSEPDIDAGNEDLDAGLELETVYLPMKVFEGEIGWPVDGELDGRFGKQLHPQFRTVTVRNGIEVEAPPGTIVRTVYEGNVVFASWFEGYGKLLIVRHPGGVHTLYGFLDDFDAAEGDWVERGEAIGWVGETGSLSGPRLYFEMRVDGKPVDPETWLDPARTLVQGHGATG
jgi:septal ring factor EnvC (AmiA/AmiB activator)